MNGYFRRSVLGLGIALVTAAQARALPIDAFNSLRAVDGADGVPFPRVIVIPDSSSLGGVKKVTMTAEQNPGGITLITGQSESFDYGLSHSEDVGSRGSVIVAWDGDPSTTTLNRAGLGGYDLTLDGATKFSFSITSLDQPAVLKLTVYSGWESSSSVTRTLTPSFTSYVFEVPFSAFNAAEGAEVFGGGGSIQNVTALELTIYGQNPATDFMINDITTNGSCTMPATRVDFVDVCGTCNGDGTSCLDCSGVPFGPNKPGHSCNTNSLGECASGIYSSSCQCEPLKEPQTEICDQRDNNCDGGIDEGSTCGDVQISEQCYATTSGPRKTLIKTFGRPTYDLAREVREEYISNRLQFSKDGQLWKQKNNDLLRTIKREFIKMEGFEYEYSDGCVCTFRETTSQVRTLTVTLNKWKRMISSMIEAQAKRYQKPGKCEGPFEGCRKRLLERIWKQRYYKTQLSKIDRMERESIKKLPSQLRACK